MIDSKEVLAEIDATNHDLLRVAHLEPTEERIKIMRAAALKAFQFGARLNSAMIQGELTVILAQIKAAKK